MAVDLAAGFSADQVRAAERPLLDAGVPLMARAAAGLADVVREVLGSRPDHEGRLLVLVGGGSNGGDALFAAAELLGDGCSATVVRLGRSVHEAGLDAALAAGAALLPADADLDDVVAAARRADVVLDGILGTGSHGPGLRSPARETVAALLPLLPGPVVVAVDLPSGIDPDDGSVEGPVLPADVTVTFGAAKAGLLLPPASRLTGLVRLVDIGLGPELEGVEPLVPAPRPRREDPSRQR
ncbi:NAD(P)H-hydrate epimerase [Amnibacterium sp. CER49]|uniref:NAD(P)H-hydrate epimerase n=1 Tax=Amnibacterium sp. CER49 TaxID=3039161 RepID=UPI002448A933|nr:NAD(P)H-hydrate epimerase [Amnibacterium sp. CER49]MDH2444758.1 NAD(P)H-hydrate epimerase [Amnibacterium sp. CER49]